MSARYSKTSSRGRSMLASTVMGSTAGRQFTAPTGSATARCAQRSGGPAQPADRVPALAVADDLDAVGLGAAQRGAQGTDKAVAGVPVDLLADERRPPAVHAAVAPGLQRADALAQEGHLELM